MPFRVYLPLTVASPLAVREEVDLVDFTYRLHEGDDLAMLALIWGVDSELMACVGRSGQEPLSELRPGTIIMVANPRYRCHTVQPDETVEQIAQDYAVALDVLLAEPWNLLETADETLQAGRRLLILDGMRPDLASLRESQPVTATATLLPPAMLVQDQPSPEKPAAWPYGDGQFIWPVRGGVISQGFRIGHRAIDIAAPIGTPVYAADNGIVIKSGYSKDGYGGRVIIDHQIDYVTLYAHLSQALVQEGDVVQKGQLIGHVGSTGNSTGPHIHIEIRDFGFLVDPRSLLSGEQ
jgi:murein DD-endopeptidase MepM/ murein hydrolase activator NlpD